MTDRTSRISGDEIESALRRSGYLLEGRIYDLIRRKQIYVEANAAFPDPVTGKSRELDVYAMHLEKAGPGEFDFLFAVLLIECVNNPQPVAFFTREPLVDFLALREVHLAGLPVKIPAKGERDQWISLPDWLKMHRYHHYCRGRVATPVLLLSKKGRWTGRMDGDSS